MNERIVAGDFSSDPLLLSAFFGIIRSHSLIQ
jgi:hypothetical protein